MSKNHRKKLVAYHRRHVVSNVSCDTSLPVFNLEDSGSFHPRVVSSCRFALVVALSPTGSALSRETVLLGVGRFVLIRWAVGFPVNSYLSQLVPCSTRTYFWSTRTYFGQLVPVFGQFVSFIEKTDRCPHGHTYGQTHVRNYIRTYLWMDRQTDRQAVRLSN